MSESLVIVDSNKKGGKNAMKGLSKSRLLAYRQCPRRLWLEVNCPELAEQEEAAEARFAAGHQVGDLARALHPGGVLVDTPDLAAALSETARLLAGQPRPLFEATFQSDGLLVRADLLLPTGSGYDLVEVKSSTSVKDYHLEDVAVQTHVLEHAGVPLHKSFLDHIDNQFVYPGGGDYRGLFARADLGREVEVLKRQVPAWAAGARSTLVGAEPGREPGEQCGRPFACPFQVHCQGERDPDAFPPEILPHAAKLARSLREAGYADLREVPPEWLSNPRHRRIRQAAVTGEPVLEPHAAQVLAALGWPRYYLDFETIAPAIPLWAGTRPYAHVPFQWSCHVETAPGVTRHEAYLADGDRDPRRPFAETLLQATGEKGRIIVYNAPFERGRLTDLAELFPDVAPGLRALAARLFDLLPLARDHYYHPAMRGSWSIKAVLPAIAPELAYDGLEVADGGQAQDAFAAIVNPDTTSAARQQLRAALLAYCALDTLAMVRVAHHFEGR